MTEEKIICYRRFKLNELTEKEISKRLHKLSGDWYKLFVYFPKEISGHGETKAEVTKNFLEEIKAKDPYTVILEDGGMT